MELEQILEHLEEMKGMLTTLGISISLVEGEVHATMTVEPRHVGAPGIAHGGAVMTLLDSALGVRAMQHALTLGKATSTVELKVNFLRPAKLGQTLVTHTTIQSAGRSLLVLSGTAVDEETEKPIAFAVGTFNVYDYQKSRLKDSES